MSLMRRRRQSVHLGRTQGGRPGFFTGRTLALGLSEEEFARYRLDPDEARARCERLDFDFEQRGGEHL